MLFLLVFVDSLKNISGFLMFIIIGKIDNNVVFYDNAGTPVAFKTWQRQVYVLGVICPFTPRLK